MPISTICPDCGGIATLESAEWVQCSAIGYAAGATPAYVGEIRMFINAALPDGWLACDGAGYSGAAGTDLQAIAELLGDGDAFYTPDLRGRSPIAAGAGAFLTPRYLGWTGGTETHLLSSAEMPSHTHVQDAHGHTLNNPAHGHTLNNPAHGHTLNNPAHGHTLNNPAHGHAITDAGHTHAIPARNATADGTALPRLSSNATPNASANSASATTGITVDATTTAVTANNATTAVTANDATTAVTANNATTAVTANDATGTNQATGGGNAHNNMHPFFVLNFGICAVPYHFTIPLEALYVVEVETFYCDSCSENFEIGGC